jgi:predicted nuclease of restriction endonuclease-like (RecB) superfamily
MPEPDKYYYTTLLGLKKKIRQARQKAAVAINKELLSVYWEIGRAIMEQQQQQGWGTKVIERLAMDLKLEFPDMKGLSPRNLRYMKSFATAWPEFSQTDSFQTPVAGNGATESILQPRVAKFQVNENQSDIILQPLVAKLPWTHHIIILNKLSDRAERLFYIHKAVTGGWNKSVLASEIENKLYFRQGKAITNFDTTLTPQQSDLVKETLKNPYLFDFLGFSEAVQERELERALVQHIKKFMLELGRGFAYVGNQYHLEVGDDEYFLDLLFYNYHLHRFVVFELKVGDFKPEYTGKLNFYINTVNQQIKTPEHQPTIGVLLCKTPNQTVVKYSLEGMANPMGIAEYEFTSMLPGQLTADMPTIEELEQELEKELALPQTPLQEKKRNLQEVLVTLKQGDSKKERDSASEKYLYAVLERIRFVVEETMADEMQLFSDASFMHLFNDREEMAGYLDEPIRNVFRTGKEGVDEMALQIKLEGFKQGENQPFSIMQKFRILLERYCYRTGMDGAETRQKFLYDYQWADAEIRSTAENWCEKLIDEIGRNIERLA